jgi:hypothetical protein
MKTFGPSGLKSFDLPLKNRALVLQAEMELKTNKQCQNRQKL